MGESSGEEAARVAGDFLDELQRAAGGGMGSDHEARDAGPGTQV